MPSITVPKYEPDDDEPQSPISLDPTTGEVDASLYSTDPQSLITTKLDNGPPKCWITGCNFRATTTSPIAAHFFSTHTCGNALYCTMPNCDRRGPFASASDFDRHLTAHPTVGVRCAICQRNNVRNEHCTFSTYTAFSVHKTASHAEKGQYTCTHCRREFTDLKLLRKCLSKHWKKDSKPKKQKWLNG
jgi:hypothetical protein